MNYRQEMLIAAAGPAASLVSGCVLLHIKPALFAISVILTAMNLLPIYPMDGGRILRSVLMLYVQEPIVSMVMRISAYSICGVLMVAACWVTAVYQAGIWPIFAVLMLLIRVGDASCGT
jgi:membrane-associated protease RseP (regulator of RpoE activity)